MKHLIYLVVTVACWNCSDSDKSNTADPTTADVNQVTDTTTAETDADNPVNDATDEPDKISIDIPEGPTFFIESLQAPTGHTQGGETVAVLGKGFKKGGEILFDGSPGKNVLYITDTRLHVTTPPHPPGKVTVTVVKPSGEFTELEDAFLYYNDVTVDTVTPNAGPSKGGTPVTVTGHGFVAGSTIIFGHRKALSVQRLNDHTMLALTPPGTAGDTDVIVANDMGVNRLKKGFKYTTPPVIDHVTPAAGPLTGGDSVSISGSGFEKPLTVWFDIHPATDITWKSQTNLIVKTPAVSSAGIVNVRVDSAQGTAVLNKAYNYTSNDNLEDLSILHLTPATGPSAGGTLVVLTTNLIGDTNTTSVTFGDKSAEIVTVDSEFNTIIVKSPPNDGPGTVDVTVNTDGQSTQKTDAFTYEKDKSATGVSPEVGPVSGGTKLTITGGPFAPTSAVYVGALAAANVSLTDSGELTATTPPGTPGQVDVVVESEGKTSVLKNAFAYMPESPEFYVTVPNQGAIAGGTWVQVIGAGFSEGAKVMFGTKYATDVTVIAPSLITARTPPGIVGPTNVIVKGMSGNVTLEDGFTYYDPLTLFGGTWGDEVDLAINVTVLDGLTAQPVPDAFVFLDNDPTTPYQGLTNAKGQITFSGPELDGAHTIGVSKEAYVTYSVVHFDAENVTVFLQPMVEGQGNMNLVPPGLVKGKVTGLGKYVVGPPGECKKPANDTSVHCDTCEPLGDCEGDALCSNLGSSLGWKCLKTCTELTDCPPKHVCQLKEGNKHCVPTPGKKVAICTGTKPYFRFMDVPLGGEAMTDKDGNFQILTFPTQIAIVCFGGFYLKDDEPTSTVLEKAIKGNPNKVFQPMVMGVVRNLTLGPAELKEGIEVKLDIPLNRTIHVRMEKPPLDDTDYLWSQTYLDLGDDGVVKMPVERFLYDDEPFLIDAMPHSFSGTLKDATFTFYSGANSYKNAAGYYYPKAYVVRQNVVEPQDDRMLRLIAGTWGTAPTGLTQSMIGSHGFTDTESYVVGTAGTAYRYTGEQYITMPTPTKKTLRDVHGLTSTNLWAVGDAGVVLNHNGAAWSEHNLNGPKDLRAVHVSSDGTVRIAGSYAFYRRSEDGEWLSESTPLGSWYDIDSVSPANIWAAGHKGAVRHYEDGKWSSVTTPTSQGLRGVAALSKNNVWFVGEAGTIMHYNGTDFSLKTPLTDQTLNGINYRNADDMMAVGRFGTVLTYDGNAWLKAPTAADYKQDLHSAVLPSGGTDAYTFGDHQLILGPIVAPPRVDIPVPKQPFTGDKFTWTADERVEPHYQRVEILVPGMMGPVLIWELIADGTVNEAPVPNFALLKGTPGLQTGTHYLRLTRVYQEGFDIDNFDYTDLGTLDRQSWAMEYFAFDVPEVEDAL